MASYVGNVQAGGSTHLVVSTLYGTCDSVASAQTKNVKIDNCDAVLLGMTIHVKFTNTNTYLADSENPMLLKLNNVATSYPICTDGNNLSPGNSALTSWRAGSVVSFTFDGASWMMNNVGLNSTCQADVQTTTPTAVKDLLKYVYPVGAIYLSLSNADPGTLFGGTWEPINDRFLLTKGNIYTGNAGTTGGAATVTLTTDQLPAHTHEISAHVHGLNSHTHSLSSHTHGLGSHTHSIPKLSGSTDTKGNHYHTTMASRVDCPWGEQFNTVHRRWDSPDDGNSKVQWDKNTGYAGNHNHTITTNASTTGGPSAASGGPSTNTSGQATGDTAANAAGTASGSTGSGSAVTILPPYMIVYAWKRTA